MGLGGGGKCRFYFYGREDFSDLRDAPSKCRPPPCLFISISPSRSGKSSGNGCCATVGPSVIRQEAAECLLCGFGSGCRSRLLTLTTLATMFGVLDGPAIRNANQGDSRKLIRANRFAENE